MRNEFTAIIEQDGPWFIAYCAKVPGANGQGATREECIGNLRAAISLVLDYRREDLVRPVSRRARTCLDIVGRDRYDMDYARSNDAKRKT